MGRLVELGRAIRITCRCLAKSVTIQFHDCGYQYKRDLKVERQCWCTGGAVTIPYLNPPRFIYVELLKYGGRDTSESS